jgi:NAD(P)-dependent dehydrogenase (short-subunit alcohol dehydrogenase family)
LREFARDLNAQRSEGRATVYSCDATDERGVREVFDLVTRDIGVPSLVVYSTQTSVPGQAIDISTSAFEDCWRINCLGGFLVAREAARQMRPRHRGSIILIGSTSGLIGREGHLSLAVGKFGLRAITQVMARELWKDGVHVAHVVIDADIDEADKDPKQCSCDPGDVAEVVYSVHRQPKSAWASELDVRPSDERFWEHC